MKKLLIMAGFIVLISGVAATEEILIEDFDSLDDWYWVRNRGATAETSSFATNSSTSLHFYNTLNYGDRYERLFSLSADNLENYVLSVWFYSNNSYTNIDIYVTSDGGVECSNSINSGFPVGSWNYFQLRIGDFEKCDYQNLVSIDRVQLYIGESPADIYIDELKIETSEEPLPPDGYSPPTYDPGWIVIEWSDVSVATVKRGEPVPFTSQVSSESGISSVVLQVEGNNFLMQRFSGTVHNGTYSYTYYPPSNAVGDYGGTIRATDLGSNSTWSGTPVFTVDPTLELSVGVEGSVQYGELLTLSGNISQAYNPVTFSVDFSGGGWSHNEGFTGTETFTHIVNTTVGLPGYWDISVGATDRYNNFGTGVTTTYVYSFESGIFDVSFLEPVETQFYAGEYFNITASVEEEGAPVDGATVTATINDVELPLQGSGTYSTSYQVPWEQAAGTITIYVEALKGEEGGLNSTSINVIEGEFQTEFGDDELIVGLPSSISITLLFNDSDPITNATLTGRVGDENITFVEVEPGVYRADYTPKGNETEMIITSSGGFNFVYSFTSRYPTVVDYIAYNVWLIIGGGVVMASGIVVIRRRARH